MGFSELEIDSDYGAAKASSRCGAPRIIARNGSLSSIPADSPMLRRSRAGGGAGQIVWMLDADSRRQQRKTMIARRKSAARYITG